jgi:hypothetical protein
MRRSMEVHEKLTAVVGRMAPFTHTDTGMYTLVH